jgi:hypothetical protein
VADYAKVSRLLGELHNAHWQSAEGAFGKAFRGRLQNFQRFGIPLGKSPGKGKKIDYKKDDVFQLAFCLEMAEFGVDPALITNAIKHYWKDELSDIFVEQAAPGKIKDDVAPGQIKYDVLFCFSPRVMSAGWGIIADPAEPSLHFWTSSTERIGKQIEFEKHGYMGRFGVINASMLHRKILQLALVLNLGDW